MLVISVGCGMRSAAGSVKVSVFTSRQPPQSFEERSNSDSIHSRAAPTPLPALIAAGSCADMVDRVLKLTNFSMSARIRSAETRCRAAAILESAGIPWSTWVSDAAELAWLCAIAIPLTLNHVKMTTYHDFFFSVGIIYSPACELSSKEAVPVEILILSLQHPPP